MTTSRARAAVAAAFLTQGLVFISLTTRLPDFSDRWDISELELSLLLLLMVLLAGVGSVVAETLAKRRASATVLRAGLGLVAVAVPVITTAPAAWVFVAGLAVYGVGLGVVDASTNMQAVALEHVYGRPILPSFHGAWTLGGVIGAGITLATSDLALSATAVLAVVPLVVLFAPFVPRVTVPPTRSRRSPCRGGAILLVGLGMVLFYMVDTAAATWGPTYLDRTFPTPSGLVALATFPYLVASGASGWSATASSTRHGAVRVLRVAGARRRAALAVVVFAPTWAVAVRRLHPARRRRRDDRAAQLLRGRADRRRRGPRPGRPAGAGRRGGRAVQPVQLRRRPVRRRADRGWSAPDYLRVGFAVPMVLILGIIPLARAFAPGVSAPRPSGVGSAS